MRKALLILLLLICLLLPSCTAPESAFIQDARIKITATLFPHYDFARIVGGDRVQVIKLLPSGTESHTYEPTAKDIVTLEDASLFLYTGPDMEPWAQTLLGGLDAPPEALDLSKGIESAGEEHEHEDHSGHSHDVSDPHIWTSPKNAIKMVCAIRDALIRLDPDGREAYEANTAAYIASLEALDTDLESIAQEAEGKTLVFGGRFAFAHLCAAYGFDHSSAYRGCDVEAEPSASDITAVIDLVKQHKIGYIFKEELTAPQSVTAIAAETGASVLLLHSCHNITQEELEKGVSYLSLMQQNVENIRTALEAEG